MTRSNTIPDLGDLVSLFYQQQSELGSFTQVDPSTIPEVYQRLLNHNHHMTVTVEDFHRSLVDVRVLDERSDQESYSRKILLTAHHGGQVVQFGIVRLNLQHLAESVIDEIQKKKMPLGRILIERNVLREVELSKVWRVECGSELAGYLGTQEGAITFGRTAMIYVDGDPAIELLEIVRPEEI